MCNFQFLIAAILVWLNCLLQIDGISVQHVSIHKNALLTSILSLYYIKYHIHLVYVDMQVQNILARFSYNGAEWVWKRDGWSIIWRQKNMCCHNSFRILVFFRGCLVALCVWGLLLFLLQYISFTSWPRLSWWS